MFESGPKESQSNPSIFLPENGTESAQHSYDDTELTGISNYNIESSPHSDNEIESSRLSDSEIEATRQSNDETVST